MRRLQDYSGSSGTVCGSKSTDSRIALDINTNSHPTDLASSTEEPTTQLVKIVLSTDTEIWVRYTGTHEYIKLVIHRRKLVGAMLVGETDLEETFENMMLNGIDICHLGLSVLNPAVDVEGYFD